MAALPWSRVAFVGNLSWTGWPGRRAMAIAGIRTVAPTGAQLAADPVAAQALASRRPARRRRKSWACRQ
jgi:hypothetical protein